jgi:hypothetical protein
MAILNVQKIVPGGLNPALVPAAVGGDSFPLSGHEEVRVHNGSLAEVTVTIAAQKACPWGIAHAAHDISVAVPAGQDRIIGPFLPVERYADANGRAQIAYSAAADVTVGVFGK